MKPFILTVLLLSSQFANSQTLFTSPYGDTATIFRLSEKEQQKLQKANSNAVAFLKRIYKSLDKANEIVKSGDYEKDQFPDMDLSADFVFGGIPPQPYKSEIALYKNYKIKKDAELKAREDSITLVYRKARIAKEQAEKDSITLVRKVEQKVSDSIYNSKPSLITSNFIGGLHNKLVLFVGYDMNMTLLFQTYLQQDLEYATVEGGAQLKGEIFSMKFAKGYMGRKPTPLAVVFTGTYNKDDAFIVKNLTITGDWDEVAHIFINYWDNVPMMLSDVKHNKPIVKNSLTDLVEFNTLPTGQARITVSRHK